MPTLPIRNILQRLEFPRRHRTRADIPHFPALDHVVKGAHYFFAVGFAVEAVDLEDVYVSIS
jgi:hypothetical protein